MADEGRGLVVSLELSTENEDGGDDVAWTSAKGLHQQVVMPKTGWLDGLVSPEEGRPKCGGVNMWTERRM